MDVWVIRAFFIGIIIGVVIGIFWGYIRGVRNGRQQIETEYRSRARDIGELLTDDIEKVRQRFVELIDPLDKTLKDLERKRAEDYGELRQQIEKLSRGIAIFTHSSSPDLGIWGEIQLERIMESAGLKENIHYRRQPSGEGGRPDMVVFLPGGGQLLIDSKMPLRHYQNACAAENDEKRNSEMKEHIKAIRNIINDLGNRKYHEQFKGSLPFVVMFIGVESALVEALKQDRELLQAAWQKNVVLASPSTLFPLLQIVASIWREYKVIEESKQITEELEKFVGHLREWFDTLRGLGVSISNAIQTYNQFISSSNQVFQSARTVIQQVTGKNVSPLQEIDLSQVAAVNKRKKR